MTVRRLGSLLMGAGILIGAAAAIWIAVGIQRTGLPWIVGVGLVKLTIVASLGLLAAGAMAARIANRDERSAQALKELKGESVPGAQPIAAKDRERAEHRPQI